MITHNLGYEVSEMRFAAELYFAIAALQQLIQGLRTQTSYGYLEMQRLPQPAGLQTLPRVQRITRHDQTNGRGGCQLAITHRLEPALIGLLLRKCRQQLDDRRQRGAPAPPNIGHPTALLLQF